MKYNFLKENITSQDIIESTDEIKESVLLENNHSQLDKILEFLNSKSSLLIATGFLGTGKTSVVRHCLNALNENVIQLWANCYESTNLDDIFLSFFEEFKRLTSLDVIKIPQTKFESFSLRINAYFSTIQKPIFVVFNSYQSLLAENAQIITDFINHLAEYENVKIIIISRNFNTEILNKSIKYEKISFKALDKDLFQKYITANKIRIHGPVFEEFYKLTKGYYFYTTLAINVMQIKNLSAVELIQKQANSFLGVKEFLFKEFLTIVDSVGGHLLRFLTVIRYPVNTTLLQQVNLYDEQRLKLYAQNYLIEIDNGNIYLKDYYKDITEMQIPPNVLVKLHRACAELYEMQLPKKPDERDLLISRRTIRQELEYHKIFIPKRVEFSSSVEVFNSQPLILSQPTKAQTDDTPAEIPTPVAEPQKPKDLQDILFVFNDEEEHLLLSDIAESINDFIQQADEKESALTTEELLELIKLSEEKFDHKRTIILGGKILQKNDVPPEILALVHKKIGKGYARLADANNAIKHFIKAQTIYNALNDKFNEEKVLLHIAKMKYLMFKREDAKNTLLELSKTENPELKIKVNLLLFDIYMEDSEEQKAFETCKDSMKLIDKSENPKIICELLFKCGLIFDAQNDTDRAIEAYEKVLKFNDDPKVNRFLPQIYSNLTTLYTEIDSRAIALDYGKKSLELGILNNNLEEQYRANLKLAQLDSTSTKTYLTNAQKLANELHDRFYAITALLEFGDYLYNEQDLIGALQKYLTAHKIAKKSFIKENMQQIEKRILDVKYRISEEEFEKEAKTFEYEK